MESRVIHVTHCSRDKDDSLRDSGKTVTPEQLYIYSPLQDFIRTCRAEGRPWAIFSDKYGVVFPEETIEWYSKPPASVTEAEYQVLLENFMRRLGGYECVYFHLRAEDSHPLFERVYNDARSRGMNVALCRAVGDQG